MTWQRKTRVRGWSRLVLMLKHTNYSPNKHKWQWNHNFRTRDENSTFLKLNYFTVEHQKLAEAVRHIFIRMNWSFLSSFHSAYHFSRNIRKEKKRRTLESFPEWFWISHYLPCYAPILVIAQDTWTLKHTNDKNEQEYVWSKTEIISLQKNTNKIKIILPGFIYIFPQRPFDRSVSILFKTDFHSPSVFIFPKHASNWPPVTQLTSSPMFVVWVHAWVWVQGKSSETIWFQKVLL